MSKLQRLEILIGILMPITASVFPLVSAIYFPWRSEGLFEGPNVGLLVFGAPVVLLTLAGILTIVGAYRKSILITFLLGVCLFPIGLVTLYIYGWATYGLRGPVVCLILLPVITYCFACIVSIKSRISES